MKISIVLSSYNGENYVREQLDSLIHQSLSADEVIISDDCSYDKTPLIISEFIKDNNLTNWKFKKNRINQGWKVNFKETLRKASGDIIFLCDQDDIWHRDKIERMTEIMSTHPAVLLLVSNYTTFYEQDGVKLGYSSSLKLNDDSVEKVAFTESNYFVRRPGCVYCLRRELLNYLPRYSYDDDPHDALLWRIALMLDGLYLWHHSTIDFRRHANNATAHEKSTLQSKTETVKFYERTLKMMCRFVQDENVNNKNEKIHVLDRLTRWNSLRTQVIIDKNIIAWIKLFPYIDCFFNKKSYLSDLYMVLGGK